MKPRIIFHSAGGGHFHLGNFLQHSNAIIAFCQSLIAPIVFIYMLPVLVGVENIWFAAPAAMVVGAILGTTFLTRKWSKLEEIVDMDDESE